MTKLLVNCTRNYFYKVSKKWRLKCFILKIIIPTSLNRHLFLRLLELWLISLISLIYRNIIMNVRRNFSLEKLR